MSYLQKKKKSILKSSSTVYTLFKRVLYELSLNKVYIYIYIKLPVNTQHQINITCVCLSNQHCDSNLRTCGAVFSNLKFNNFNTTRKAPHTHFQHLFYLSRLHTYLYAYVTLIHNDLINCQMICNSHRSAVNHH